MFEVDDLVPRDSGGSRRRLAERRASYDAFRVAAVVASGQLGVGAAAETLAEQIQDHAAASLAGVEVAEEGLLANTVRTAPARVTVQSAVLLGLW